MIKTDKNNKTKERSKTSLFYLSKYFCMARLKQKFKTVLSNVQHKKCVGQKHSGQRWWLVFAQVSHTRFKQLSQMQKSSDMSFLHDIHFNIEHLVDSSFCLVYLQFLKKLNFCLKKWFYCSQIKTRYFQKVWTFVFK